MKSTRGLPFYLVMLVSLCLCSLVLREVASTGGNRLATNLAACEPQDLSQHNGLPEATHIHDHEHPVLQAAPVAPQAHSAILHAAGPESLPTHSRAVSPQLPPPKVS
jgi:hypothetical protein